VLRRDRSPAAGERPQIGEHFIMVTGSILAACLSLQQIAPADAEVSKWVKDNAHPIHSVTAESGFDDLQAFKAIVGDARIVSLGEATHGSREVFQMKHRLLEFLVKEMGFTTFAIEASLPDCLPINEYVLTGTGDLEEVVAGQGFYVYNTEEVRDMVEWMRRYNADPKTKRKVTFYGVDVQDASSAVTVALNALSKVNAKRAAELRSSLQWVINAGHSRSHAREILWARDLTEFWNVPQSYRDEISRRLDDLSLAMVENKQALTAAFGESAYSDRQRAAVVAKQAFLYYENLYQSPYPVLATIQDMAVPSQIGTVGNILGNVASVIPIEIRVNAAALFGKMRNGAKFMRDYYLAQTAAERQFQKSTVKEIGMAAETLRELVPPDQNKYELDYALKNLPLIFDFLDKFAPKVNAIDKRDQAMAANVRWLLQREGPHSRVVLWAHNGHIARSPQRSLGMFLTEESATDNRVIGFSVYKGSLQAKPSSDRIEERHHELKAFYFGPSPVGTLDHTFAQTGLSRFYLDVRNPSDPAIKKWLDTPIRTLYIGSWYPPDRNNTLLVPVAPGKAYDAMIFIKDTSRAIPTRLARKRFGIESLEPANRRPW